MRILLGMAALFCPLSLVLAQDSPQLTPRARLRVTVASPVPLRQIGTYQALTDSMLVVASGASAHSIPLASIHRLELSRGRKPSVLGGLAGLLVGGAAGGLVACAVNTDDYGVFCAGQDDTKVVIGAALGGAVGATLGALLFRRDRWLAIDVARLGAAGP